MITEYIKAFIFGGLLCVIGQLLVDHTSLTPARILTGYVVCGVVLSAAGLYGTFAEFAGAGATVPLTGFGNVLANGVREAIREKVFWAYSPADWKPLPAGLRRRFSSGCAWR